MKNKEQEKKLKRIELQISKINKKLDDIQRLNSVKETILILTSAVVAIFISKGFDIAEQIKDSIPRIIIRSNTLIFALILAFFYIFILNYVFQKLHVSLLEIKEDLKRLKYKIFRKSSR